MTRTQTSPPQRPSWIAVARTGWASKEAARAQLSACDDCDHALVHCEGCQEPRCIACEPYLSDDCRWSI